MIGLLCSKSSILEAAREHKVENAIGLRDFDFFATRSSIVTSSCAGRGLELLTTASRSTHAAEKQYNPSKHCVRNEENKSCLVLATSYKTAGNATTMANCSILYPPTTTVKNLYHGVPQRQVSTEEHLIYLTRTVIDLCNARLYSHPFFRTHLSPTMHNDMNGDVGSGIDLCIHNYKVVADASPAFHAAIFNESALIDEGKGVGTVLLSQDMSEHSYNGGKMSGAIAFTWKTKDGGWVCTSVCMMYGTPEFLAM